MKWSKKHETSFANNEILKFYFWRKSRFFEEENPQKVNTVEEEQDGINITGIGNLMDLPKLMFTDEECGNLKVVVDGG